MSWFNPSQDEAAEEYYSSKSRYTNAANQRYSAIKAAENCSAERSQALSSINSCMNDKINFEKRIEDIKSIIGAISGTSCGGASIGVVIPDVIVTFNNSAQKTDDSYRGCMKCSDIAAASIFDVFKSRSVEEDPDISDALIKFKNELTRLEQAVIDLQNQLNSLNSLVNSLNTKINTLNAEAADCRKIMVSTAFEMNHFKGYM